MWPDSYLHNSATAACTTAFKMRRVLSPPQEGLQFLFCVRPAILWFRSPEAPATAAASAAEPPSASPRDTAAADPIYHTPVGRWRIPARSILWVLSGFLIPGSLIPGSARLRCLSLFGLLGRLRRSGGHPSRWGVPARWWWTVSETPPRPRPEAEGSCSIKSWHNYTYV